MAKQITDLEISRAMGALGSRITPTKTESSRRNAAKAASARRKNPLDLPCVCSGGDSLNASDHKTTCPRGRLLWQRERAAKKAAEKQASK